MYLDGITGGFRATQAEANIYEEMIHIIYKKLKTSSTLVIT